MLPSSHKLRTRDFELVFKQGKTVVFGNIFLKICKNSLDISRFGIAVGIKISKKATERNRIKRQIRRILRQNLGKIARGYDVVIVVRKEKGKTGVEIEKLRETLEGVFEKASLMN